MIRQSLVKISRYLTAPILLLIIVGVVFALYAYAGFPSRKEVIVQASEWIALYGAPVLFLIAIAEGTVLFNWYLPGTTIIFLSYILASQSHHGLVTIGTAVCLGMFIASLFNYEIGRRGLFKFLAKFGIKGAIDAMQHRIERHGLKLVFFSYIHISVGAMAVAGAGALNKPRGRVATVALSAILFWNAMWILISRFLGSYILRFIQGPILFGIIGLWFVAAIVMYFQKERSEEPKRLP